MTSIYMDYTNGRCGVEFNSQFQWCHWHSAPYGSP